MAMTQQQAEQFVLEALTAIRDLAQYQLSITPTDGIVVSTQYGDITIMDDGKVIFDPNSPKQLQKSIKSLNRSQPIMSQPAGVPCPTCHGKGTL